MAATHNWSQLAAKFDNRVLLDGIPVTLYRPHRVIPGGVPIEQNPALVRETTALVIQGGNNPDQPTLAGLSPEQQAEAHFLTADLPYVTEGAFLQDAGGLWWRIHSNPDIQRAGAAGTLVGIAALLTLQSQKPAGIP